MNADERGCVQYVSEKCSVIFGRVFVKVDGTSCLYSLSIPEIICVYLCLSALYLRLKDG